MPNKIYYTWEQLQQDVEATVRTLKLLKEGTFKNIYGIPRGGLIVAVLFSHQLEIPIILDPNLIEENTLVVDDISDKGDTLIRLLGDVSVVRVVTLWISPETQAMPYLYQRTKNPSDWIVFPWETEASSKYDNTI